ncbi:uncharacterized protein LOC143470231 isoform X1 [Clavelina lepadiformis]|uniref:uncharacterized protein LOC143470231 isoform X1 n=1 Tax=Clavelina lepadiformis TaxID=159417 RepID=UPI004041FBAB
MYSFNSPIKSHMETPGIDTVSPTKGTRVSISLNGLFGEAGGLDDHLPASLSVQSPPCGSGHLKSIQTSPYKSQTGLFNGGQQPILLSELAEFSPHNRNCSPFYGNTLCSYVSPHDNSRCTNLAAATCGIGKSFCRNHLELPKPGEITVNGIPQKSSTNFAVHPQQLNERYLTADRSQVLVNGSTCPGTKPGNMQGITLNTLNGGFTDTLPRRNSVAPKLGGGKGIDKPDSRSVGVSQNSAASSIAVPVSLFSNPSLVTDSNRLTKEKKIQASMNVPQSTAGGNTFAMDGEFLQAFVDFLNQNQDRLTAKQQIELLNSLGVTVATVKNPEDLHGICASKKQQTHRRVNNNVQKSVKNSHKTTVYNMPASMNTSSYGTNHVTNQAMSTVNQSNQVNVTGLQPFSQTSDLKRKADACGQAPSNAKKPKKSSTSSTASSLQHLSSSELDRRVLEALASVGGLTVPHKNDNTVETPKILNKSKYAKLNSTSSRLTTKLDFSKQIILPSVNISVNRNKNSDKLNVETSVNALRKYVDLQIDNSLRNQDLFPLGPFCDDGSLGLCTCVPSQSEVQPVIKSKNIQPFTKRHKNVDCETCRKMLYADPSQNYFHKHLHFPFMTCMETKQVEKLMRGHESPGVATAQGKQCVTDDPASPTKRSSVSRHCRRLNQNTKKWKALYKREKKQIKLLTEAAKASPKETALVLSKLGTKPITCAAQRKTCAKVPSLCTLTDRSGARQCENKALPFACYCHNHIWHSEIQQLYKLDTSMNVVADIYVDPPSAKQRKKTKLPPLSKRKRRRIKKGKLSKTDPQASDSHQENNSPKPIAKLEVLADLPSPSKEKSLNTPSELQGDSVDENKNNNADGTTNLASNVSGNGLPIAVDDDSNCGVFEAFSLDGNELLNDVMPNMFSELGLFSGKSSEVLDNALLLAGAVDSENSNIDINIDELNENGLFFPSINSMESRNAAINETIVIDSSDDQKDTSTTIGSAKASAESSAQTNNPNLPSSTNGSRSTSPCAVASQQSIGLSQSSSSCSQISLVPPQINSDEDISKWLPGTQFSDNVLTEKKENLSVAGESTSLDSSIVEDLHELEGVIQSLQDETAQNNSQCNRELSTSSLNADEYTSILARELSMDAENKAFHSSLSSSPIITPPPETVSWSSVPSSPAEHANINITTASNITFNLTQTNRLQQPTVLSTDDAGIRIKYSNVGLKAKGLSPKGNRKTKNRTPSKRKPNNANRSNLPMDQILPSLSENNLKTGPGRLSNTSILNNSKTTQAKPTNVIKAAMNSVSVKSKGGKKPRCTAPVPNFFPANTPHTVAFSPQSIRMQPRLVTGNVVCASVKGNSAVNNQSMVLIPVSAVVRTANQTVLQGTGQNLGIAFAVPAQANSASPNMNTIIPIRGNALLSGVSNGQQVLILNGAQTTLASVSVAGAVPVNTNLNQSPTVKPAEKEQCQNLGHGMSTKAGIATYQQNPSFGPNGTSKPVLVQSAVKPATEHSKTHRISSPTVVLPSTSVAQTSSPVFTNIDRSVGSIVTTAAQNQGSQLLSPKLSLNATISCSASSLLSKTTTVKDARTVPEVMKTSPSSKGGTVHWNQTMAGPDAPLPQPRMYGSVGGQTSNMLYCRRISPSLNNTQHVIVGRLGSLGRVGLSRLTIGDQANGFERLTFSNQIKGPLVSSEVISEPKNLEQANNENLKTVTSRSNSTQVNKSCLHSTTNDLQGSSLNATDANVVVALGTSQDSCTVSDAKSPGSNLDTETGNSPLPCHKVNQTLNNEEIIKLQTSTPVRHNSRKSDHKMTLQDPDFCDSLEEETDRLQPDISSTYPMMHLMKDKKVSNPFPLKPRTPSSINETVLPSSVDKIKDGDSGKVLVNCAKATRRAAILRKR